MKQPEKETFPVQFNPWSVDRYNPEWAGFCDNWHSAFLAMRIASSPQRRGQMVMNTCPDSRLVTKVISEHKEVDCWDDDEKIPEFVEVLHRLWKQEQH